MSKEQQRSLEEQIQSAFKTLCDENPPRAFIAITVGEDMMVNFASFGVETAGTLELLEHMLDYIKQKEENEDEFGRNGNTKIH